MTNAKEIQGLTKMLVFKEKTVSDLPLYHSQCQAQWLYVVGTPILF